MPLASVSSPRRGWTESGGAPGRPLDPAPPSAIEADSGGSPWRRRALALYHLHLKNISRADGTPDRPRSAVACAAYRAGETLWNEAEEKDSQFGGRRDVVFTDIRLPAGAPAWMADRATLWNAVETVEVRKDARLAKEVEFSLPRELPRADWIAVARAMADAYASRGFAIDLAIHDDGTLQNPHVHMMMTTRLITSTGFGGKIREADGKPFLKDLRATWERVANAALARAGVAITIDARSHAARGIDREPGQHQGPDPAARRERRERMDPMPMNPVTAAAHRDLLAEEGVRDRYPLLAAREDWPPQERSVPAMFSTPEHQEEDRFWAEVEQRAQADRQPSARAGLDLELEAALERVRAARAMEEGSRSVALAAVRHSYDEVRDKLVLEMVKAGLIEPRTVDQLRQLENTLYKDEFERMRAEAQRNEARRREVGHWPEATPEQRARLAERERREEERKFDEYDRRLQHDQEPDPDGRPITREVFHRAQDAMVREMEAQARIPAPDPVHVPEEKRDARGAANRLAALPVPERDAHSYRLAPQERTLSWLETRRQERQREAPAAARREEPVLSRTADWFRQRMEARDAPPALERKEADPERDGNR